MSSRDAEIAQLGRLRPYAVYHWDTFEEPGDDTTLLTAFDSQAEAEAWIERKYGPDATGPGQRIREDGADQLHIVYKGAVVKRYAVG